jgi:hypothetical protein
LNQRGKRITYHLLLYLILMVFVLPLFTSVLVHAQETETESAEVVAEIINLTSHKIPSIKTSNWTSIDIKVIDGYGLNWTALHARLPILSTYVWPIIHPTWKRFLGYSSLRFEPEIVQGDPRGWYTKITPSAITTADQGKEYYLTLEVQTDDIAVDYSVVVGIKVIRVAPDGEDYGTSYIYIPVKASSLNNLKMTTGFSSKEASPHSYVYFDISLLNLGYYRDMFSLTFVEESGLTIGASQQVVVLDPEESQNVRFNVLTEEKFFDIGTSNKISIYATSVSDPNPQLLGTVIVTTRGFYFSPLIGIILGPIVALIIIIFLFWFFIKRRRDLEVFGKPQKPWTLPEEKPHLQALKEEDKQAYEQERKMMNDEYKSALLWYQHERQTMKYSSEKEEKTTVPLETVPRNNFTTKISGMLKKTKEKIGSLTKREEPKKKPSVQKKKSVKKPIKKQKKEPEKPAPPTQDMRKEEALAKIKKEQEKQRRKLQ